ncbi:hypothetical protein CC86DRAFT_408104 [Ophiobolus disseminans]|uniref:Uncharacterized protein n=1 Tax=Ophiobolus disseminans TaxID=1469910 RepID=A0A6A6ZXA5_9PLEO|nr:hypothetical protein CC86DRAFT_408104 [Ophiobolus disseminans]
MSTKPTYKVNKEGHKFMYAGLDKDNKEIVLALYERGTSSYSSFTFWPKHEATKYESVKIWDAPLQTSVQKKAHMRTLKSIWVEEIGHFYKANTSGGITVPSTQGVAPTNAPQQDFSPLPNTPTVSSTTAFASGSSPGSPSLGTPGTPATPSKRANTTSEYDIFWNPTDAPPSRRQIKSLGLAMKKDMRLKGPPPDSLIKSMIEFKIFAGRGVTPFQAPQWEEWLILTDNIRPQKHEDTSLEALCALFSNPSVGQSVRNETPAEREAVLGRELMDKLDKQSEWLEGFLASTIAVEKHRSSRPA